MTSVLLLQLLLLTLLVTASRAVDAPTCPTPDPDGQCPQEDSLERSLASGEATLQDVLNPQIFQDPSSLQTIRDRIQVGQLVVIKNAFRSDFANYVWEDLYQQDDSQWQLNAEFDRSGFGFSHHNIYDPEDFSKVMNETFAIFNHPNTKQYMEELSGRSCTREKEIYASPSRYFPGDFSLPHTDRWEDRTIAFVWHLSKDWRPEWGGALYWCSELQERAYLPASFNTLSLFSVTTYSSHFVTAVSPHAKGKRLSFNGWYEDTQSAFQLSDPMEVDYADREQMLRLTAAQYENIQDMNMHQEKDPTRREKLLKFQTAVHDFEFEPAISSFVMGEEFGVEAQDVGEYDDDDDEEYDEDEDWEDEYDDEDVYEEE